MKPSHPLTSRRPEDIIAWSGGREINVRDFVARVHTLAADLPQHEYVINLASDRYDFLVGFCSAITAGQCTLLPPNRQPETLQRLIDDYPDCYVIGDSGIDRVQNIDVGNAQRRQCHSGKCLFQECVSDQLTSVS